MRGPTQPLDNASPTTMNVLGYVHTFNDAEVIEATIAALGAQTCPVPEILLVDNASTDGTLNRTYPSHVTIIRNAHNLGTSGAVAIGMQYALAHGYDWIYILDADSKPAPDAIENLLRCYRDLTPGLQATTWWLSSLLREAETGLAHHGCLFAPGGIKMLEPPPEPSHYACHSNMWSGSLYRLDAVKEVGPPDPDYVLDWGDVIYGYEGMIRGYTGFLEQSSVVLHKLHPIESLRFRRFVIPLVRLYYWPPIRAYYFWRNSFYFWVYKSQPHSWTRIARHSFLFCRWLLKIALFIKAPGPILRSCVRGMWDGIHARLKRRY